MQVVHELSISDITGPGSERGRANIRLLVQRILIESHSRIRTHVCTIVLQMVNGYLSDLPFYM
jgi:hypothetical protein